MSTRDIVLDGGSPWGFRMHGGADVSQPLRISRVSTISPCNAVLSGEELPLAFMPLYNDILHQIYKCLPLNVTGGLLTDITNRDTVLGQ